MTIRLEMLPDLSIRIGACNSYCQDFRYGLEIIKTYSFRAGTNVGHQNVTRMSRVFPVNKNNTNQRVVLKTTQRITAVTPKR